MRKVYGKIVRLKWKKHDAMRTYWAIFKIKEETGYFCRSSKEKYVEKSSAQSGKEKDEE